MSKILTINVEKCTGCRTCEIACSLKHAGEFNPARSRIHNISSPEEGFYLPVACLQCSEPFCVQICPNGAITRDEITGIVKILEKRCVGCKMCLLACPFGSITFDSKEEKAIKCDLCDGEPECVAFCATGALEFKEAEIAVKFKKRALSDRLKEIYKGISFKEDLELVR